MYSLHFYLCMVYSFYLYSISSVNPPFLKGTVSVKTQNTWCTGSHCKSGIRETWKLQAQHVVSCAVLKHVLSNSQNVSSYRVAEDNLRQGPSRDTPRPTKHLWQICPKTLQTVTLNTLQTHLHKSAATKTCRSIWAHTLTYQLNTTSLPFDTAGFSANKQSRCLHILTVQTEALK